MTNRLALTSDNGSVHGSSEVAQPAFSTLAIEVGELSSVFYINLRDYM